MPAAAMVAGFLFWRNYLKQCFPVPALCGPNFDTNNRMRILGFDISIRSQREKALETELRSLQQQSIGPSGWGHTYDALFHGGGTITRKKALSVPAVWAAVDTVSKTLASLPFQPFRRTENGSEPAFGHPLFQMETMEPSPLVTAFNFRRDMFADACFGNAYAKIYFKGNGRAYKMERLVPEDCVWYPSENGEMYLIVNRMIGAKYVQEILSTYEVLHIRGMSIDGYDGINVANNFSSALSMSIDATQYGVNYFYNNAAVGGVIEVPGGLSPAQRQTIENKVNEKHSGLRNVGSAMVLDAGMKFTPITNTPQNSMLNETRTFQAYESCRIFGVPAHMISVLDRATFNNIEMMDNGFVKYCLAPWAKNAEQEHDVKLLTKDEKQSGSVFHRFNLSGLMRGDTKSRGEYNDIMLKNLVYTVNDVREMDNLNRVPWGDKPFAQAGVTPVNEDGTIDLNTPAESAGTNIPDNGTPQAGQ